MGIVLFRVDERLIHGQVTLGWGGRLGSVRYIVVDDVLPARATERDLYALGVPERAVAEFYTVEEARGRLKAWAADETPSVLLTRDLDHMLRLAREGALTGQIVNLGGLHYAPGRSRVLPYLFLDDADRARVAALLSEGVEVSAQDLPKSRRISGRDLIDA